jgi:hypothetical protein
MKKNTLVWIAVYGLVAYGSYYAFFSKTAYAKKIIKAGKSNQSLQDLKIFDMAFLRAWSKAAGQNTQTFDYNGKTYNTQGGKAVK